MRFLFLVLLFPLLASGQFNKTFVAKPTLYYTRLEYSGEGLFGFEADNKFGYMDANQKVIIPATLEFESTQKIIPTFSNGMIYVKKDGKAGAIDKTGKQIIPYEYKSLWGSWTIKSIFVAGKEIDKKIMYGLISAQNKIIIPFDYTSIITDSNLISVQQNNKWGIYDITGKSLVPIEYSSITLYPKNQVARVMKDDKYGFIDMKGNWLFEKSKTIYSLYGCANGLILCKVNNKFGYLDLKGNEVIVTKYDDADNFNEFGIAKAGKLAPDNSYKKLYGYINTKGEEIIPLKYESLSAFSNGLAYAKDPETNRYGFLDKTGKWALKPIYISISENFDNSGGAWVRMTDDKFHYINKAGKDFGLLDSLGKDNRRFTDGYSLITNTDYRYAVIDNNGKPIKYIDDCDNIYTISEGMGGYKAKSNSLYGFVDINGNKIGKPEYTGFNGFSEGYSRVAKTVNGKTRYGYVNNKAEEVIPVIYESAYNFNNGWGLVVKDSTYYFIDKNGNLKDAPADYDQLSEFKSGFAVGTIKNDDGTNTYYYINTELKEVFSIKAKSAWSFWEDVAVIKRDALFELINKKGESIKVLSDIDMLKFSNEGKLGVRINKKWGFIDNKGNQSIAPQYDSCDSYKEGYAKIQKGTKWGIIDNAGKIILEPVYKNIIPGENGIFIFLNSYWGIVDKNNQVLCPETFLTITPFHKNRAMARYGKYYTLLKSPLAK